MESMHKTHKDMQRISIPPDKLHLTLGVFNIASDTQLEKSISYAFFTIYYNFALSKDVIFSP